MARREATCSPDDRWRPNTPADRRGPVCGYTLRNVTCSKRGAHYCQPRADRVVYFFAELLVHTKSRWARRAFVLDAWQEHDIIRPLFGEVVWSEEWQSYVRRFRIAWIELARKNGKSELAAGIVLYLLIGDDEVGAEVYGAAKDTKQAGKVGQVVLQMARYSPELRRRLEYNKNERRLFDEKSGSYYEVITADAAGELGHNPHGVVVDEIVAQASGDLWTALYTALGTRPQALMVGLTTETNDPSSFCAAESDEMAKIAADPGRDPTVFVYQRKVPREADPWDESRWPEANPALGSFLSWGSLRAEANAARTDPRKENAFRQFRLNQRVSQVTRLLPLHEWDECAGEVALYPEWVVPRLRGRRCWAGLDLSGRSDLTAWCLLFPFDAGELLADRPAVAAWWRFWLPETVVARLDKHNGGLVSVWAEDGWITLTEGDVIDYDRVYDDIEADAGRFEIVDGSYDPWSGAPAVQEVEKRTGLDLYEVNQQYSGMTLPMKAVMDWIAERRLVHFGNPVARWHADSLEARSPTDNPDLMRPSKPNRQSSGKRVDGMSALFDAASGLTLRGDAVSDDGFAAFGSM
ncbi:MAG TPA: terminase TerL endonuclease subunit [Acidimicrobiales bacterium]|jgi:phage terminase large subunit-like protein